MENKGLIFIPDISGFTRFVHETEIEHSRMIIQELLETLINANEIGLEISEIEGDAILFYKFGEPPTLEALYRQVEKMFCSFHDSMAAYEYHRYCQCQACTSAISLTLKVITHYGEFTGYQVANFSKLIGKDLIVAHQLLKNEIPQHEYWLVTKNLTGNSAPGTLASWMQWNSGAKHTETGDITFHYTQLTRLKDRIISEGETKPVLDKKVKAISVQGEFDTDIITLFHATGDFNYRHRWMQGVKKVEVMDHKLPRVGMKCRCVLDSGETIIYSSSYRYQADHIEFSETDENHQVVCYTLDKIESKKTRLTLDLYIPKNLVHQITYRLLNKRQTITAFQNSMKNLSSLVKELKIPTAVN
jgi:hypothetical protein